jgi:hypothetical protein
LPLAQNALDDMETHIEALQKDYDATLAVLLAELDQPAGAAPAPAAAPKATPAPATPAPATAPKAAPAPSGAAAPVDRNSDPAGTAR